MHVFVCHSAQQSPSGKQGVPEGRRVLSGEMAQQGFLQPPCPVGSVALGTWLPLHSLWVDCASCWGGPHQSTGSRSWTGATFQPSFLPSSKQRLCFQAAAKNIKLMTGWDPSFPDSANSCCCFSAHQSVQNSSSKHPQTALWQLAAKSHAQTTCHPQKSLSANSQGHQQKLQAGFLAGLPACPPNNPPPSHSW